jgi:hypothetical protein
MEMDEETDDEQSDSGLTAGLGEVGVRTRDAESADDLSDDDDDDDEDEDDWLKMSVEDKALAQREIEIVKDEFQDDVDMFDTTMVAEYADEIFNHMEELEVRPCGIKLMIGCRHAQPALHGLSN